MRTHFLMCRAIVILSVFLLIGCRNGGVRLLAPDPTVEQADFGTLPDGRKAQLFTLKNGNGMIVRLTNYGGCITEIHVPDRQGKMADVVLGFDDLDRYLKHSYCGAIVGRYANRIAGGKFTLDGKKYTLATNNGPNHLHGGRKGFDKILWQARPFQKDKTAGVELSYVSPDGEEGYPGTLTLKVVYSLNNQNELRMEYYGTTDKPTICNLSHHGYFNLGGHDSGDTLGHQLWINADRFTPVDKTLIPTGELRPVKETAFDFTRPRPIGDRLNIDVNEQLQHGGGYDINFALNDRSGQLHLAASVYEPKSGRYMELITTEPGVQFYGAQGLDGSTIGKGKTPYRKYAGFCLEAQHYPDSPNKPDFPSATLRPGETYRQTTIYRFSTL